MAYEEATGGALTTALTPDDVTAMVAKYLQAENVDLSALTPDQIEAIVSRYAEATGCDKSQLLPSFTAYITEYKEAEGVSVPKPKTQVIITGYDYLAYRQLQNNPDLTLELPVRLGELPDGELDRLMADGKSPSQVFRDEVGVMTMRGFGAGVLKESKEQARVIRNASRFLTGEAREGSIVTNSNDNRRTYNNNVSSTIQVQQMVVRDEQDIRSLAVEIATLTRRQQRGKGLRMA